MTKPLDDKTFLSSYFIVIVIQHLQIKWSLIRYSGLLPCRDKSQRIKAKDTLVLMFAEIAQTTNFGS